MRSKVFVCLFIANCLLLPPFGGTNCFSQVVINEYSCSNVNSFADSFGEYEDWIELYNTTASAVNITGWHLSDKKTNPTKWQLGVVSIPASGFVRIWASGRAINVPAPPVGLNANFKLTQCKPEAIVLADAAGTIIDSLTLKPAQAGHSRGRTTNGSPAWSVFLTPTPAASNTNPYQEYATKPTMSVAAGFYAATQNITITSPDPNITIRYTTNGTTPTVASALYSGPVTVSVTTVLRAKAYSSTSTIPSSFIESNTYFINSTHTVEVISVFGDQLATLLGGTQSNPQTGLEYFDATGAFKTESYGEANKHGNDSWSYPQRGIDFVSMDAYGYNYALQHTIFNSKPRTEYQRIIIKASAGDNYPFETTGNPYAWGPASQLGSCHIRDQYVHTLSQKAKLHMDERTWAPSVLYVNGNYWGVYDTREKVDDADFLDYYHNSDSQFSNSPDQDSLQFLKTWGGTWSEYGGVTAQNEWNALSGFITGNNMAIQANYDYVDSLYSVKSLSDYVILNSLCVTSDWLNWNTEWWRGKHVNANKKKWRYGLWDEDATFDHYIDYTGVGNTTPTADPCAPQNLGDPGGQGHVPILNALLQNPTFKQYYVMRYFDLLNSSLSCNRMITILDSMILVITPEMPAQITRWNGSGGSLSQWQQNVQDLRNFILTRCTTVVQGFAPCNGTTGPYPIKVNVVPAGAGTVDVNSINVSSFVWSATYPGGVNMNFVAHPNTPYCFDHWEFQNHTPLPSTTDSAVSVNLTMTDSIVAVFTTSSTLPSVTASDSVICPGDSVLLQVSSGSSFSWSPSTGLSCTTCPNPVATPSVSTTYSVFVSGSCAIGAGSITINLTSPGVPTATAVNPTICVGSSTTLNVNGGSNFIWSPSTGLSCTTCPNPVASPTASTIYSVTASGGSCINGTGVVTVNVTGPPIPSTGGDATICSTSSTELSASGGSSYTWTPSTGLTCTNCPNPTASPNTTTTYTLIVSSSAPNCFGVDTVTVFVTGDCPDIYVPTGFSPNGDNNNDMLYIFGGDVKQLHFVVYNRWGQIVFETKDQTIGWDGTHNGKMVQSGVYAYKLIITNSKGVATSTSGNLTVIR